MKLINLNETSLDSIELPEDKYDAFIICNNTLEDAAFLDKLITSNVNNINFYGKWSLTWQITAEKIQEEYNKTRSKNVKGVGVFELKDLYELINVLWICESDSFQAVLMYDDENLKDYVLKRLNIFLSEKLTSKQRIELHAHTNKTRNLGISSPTEMYDVASTDIIDEGKQLDGIAITDHLSLQAFKEVQEAHKENKGSNFKLICGCEVPVEKNRNITILCKNNDGKKALNKILTAILTNRDEDKTFYDLIDENRKDLLIGSGINFHFVDETIRNDTQIAISFFDFVEVAPISSYKLSSVIAQNEALVKCLIKDNVKKAHEFNKPVVATSIPYYATANEYLEFSVLYDYNNKNKKLEGEITHHILSTEEMLYEFDWLNDDKLVEDIVINNTHKIADMCEELPQVEPHFYPPIVDDAFEKVKSRAYDKCHEIYGDDEDIHNAFIWDRLEEELQIIEEHNYASIFYIASEICRIAKEQGYRNSVRGTIGSSFVGFLLGITECNPLLAHSVCNKCHQVVVLNTRDGYNEESRNCKCGGIAKTDGHNLHYEMLFGVNGDKISDIDLNLDSEFLKSVPSIIEKIAPKNRVVKAGWQNTIGTKKACEILNDFAGEDEGTINDDLRYDMIDKLNDVANKHSAVSGGLVIIPNNVDINEFTAIEENDGELCTHIDYYDVSNNFYKLDCCLDIDMKSFNILESNGINIDDINVSDPELYKFINGEGIFKNCSLLGIDEFNSYKAPELIIKFKPHNFEELVKISSLSYSTGAWKDNQDSLCEHGLPLDKVIASRDDILNFLLYYGVPFADAYNLMEYVRKGKASTGFKDEHNKMFKDYSIPSTFVDVCKKIYYVFPKAHSIGYAINTLRMAWVKLYKPAYFYADYFANRAEKVDLDIIGKSADEIHKHILNIVAKGNEDDEDIETLELAEEMQRRGIKLTNIDASNSDELIGFDVSKDDENQIICYKANV